MHDILLQINQLLSRANLNQLQHSKDALESQSQAEGFWTSPSAQAVMKDIKNISQELSDYSSLKKLSLDLHDLNQLISDPNIDNDEKISYQVELSRVKNEATELAKKIQTRQYLSGPFDIYGCLFSIHSGQGGTEAMDWAQIVSRMYVRYFERKEWDFDLLSISQGEEAGIKSIEYLVRNRYAYGLLKHERGTHRLVRLSPFNADNLRQTSFALVEVLPAIPPTEAKVTIPEDELEWKFSRSSGAGGQNVNKVNTAVELRHIPTQTVVKCQEERSQVQNKERALQKMRAILAQKEENDRLARLAKEKGTHTNASWGNQIRNYVLHPYKLVKDTRTKVETSDTESVLDGDLEQFIQAEVTLD